jgi:multidrug efflux pump subunit AcrA (membrane-fusion protein)
MLIAVVCVFSAVWYTPGVIRSDRRLLMGTVTNSGVVTLNFTVPGQIKQMNAQLGETVRKGQVLAVEDAPHTESLIAADKAAIAYDRAKIAQLGVAQAASLAGSAVDKPEIAVAKAQLVLDEAHLAADRLKVASTEIIAPASGIVVAADGQPGETATPSGVRAYVAGSQQSLPPQQPEFSLFPEGPQSLPRPSRSAYSLPVIALRTSTAWQVVVLVPEASASRIGTGSKVTIDVPAAHVRHVPGKVDAVLPTPVPTSTGTAYQAKVTVTGRTRTLPLNGMAADIQLGS